MSSTISSKSAASPSSFGQLRALWLREWLASSRLARTPWLVAGAGFALGCLLLLVGVTSWEPSSDVGRKLFHLCFAMMSLFVTLFGPAIAANTIALEREGKTWEALVMAGVAPRAIDRGKFLGSYTHLSLYVLGLLPCAGIPHLFGGVSYVETLFATVMVFALGALAVRFGLFMSALVPSTRAALLTTLCASAALCFVVLIVGYGATELLRQDVGMTSLRNEGPIFWPVALVHERFGFDYARYLIVVPIGAVLVTWFSLRELTVQALDTTRRRTHHLATYLAVIAAFAVLLGLVPNRPSELIVSEIVFTILSFGAIVVMNGDRPARATSSVRSLVLIGGGSAGVFVVLFVSKVVLRSDPYDVYAPRLDPLANLLLYAPAFTVFATGLSAFVRTTVRRPAIARAVTAAVAIAIAFVPLVFAVFLKATERSTALALAASPVGALMATDAKTELICAAAFWTIVGSALLAITHRRERHAMRA